MAASTTLLQFLLMVVAGWLQRQQAATIDYLKAENRMLRARLGGRRIVFTDAERRQLAEKARALGRKAGVTFALPSSTASWRSSSTCKPGETVFSQKKKRSAHVSTSSNRNLAHRAHASCSHSRSIQSISRRCGRQSGGQSIYRHDWLSHLIHLRSSQRQA